MQEKILIADDYATFRETRLPKEAADDGEAVQFAGRMKPDLVLTDIEISLADEAQSKHAADCGAGVFGERL